MARSDGTPAAEPGRAPRRRGAADGGEAGRSSGRSESRGGSRSEDGEARSRSTRPIANPLNAGEGILRRMAELNDHPIRDAEFLRNGDGSLVEQCWGTKGLYMASNASGGWEVAGPFGGGA